MIRISHPSSISFIPINDTSTFNHSQLSSAHNSNSTERTAIVHTVTTIHMSWMINDPIRPSPTPSSIPIFICNFVISPSPSSSSHISSFTFLCFARRLFSLLLSLCVCVAVSLSLSLVLGVGKCPPVSSHSSPLHGPHVVIDI